MSRSDGVVFSAVSVESSCKDTTGYSIKGMTCNLEINPFPNMLNFETSGQKLDKYCQETLGFLF